MQVVTEDLIKGKKVLLRYDIDVVLEAGRIVEDFKLKAGLETLKLCLRNSSKVIIIGHLGRPFATAEDEKKGNPSGLSAKPVQVWFEKELREKVFFADTLEKAAQSDSKTVLLENIRFFHGEVPGSQYHATCTSKTCDVDFASQLASLGNVYVNEAFSAHNLGASTTMVPTLLPHAAGLHFAEEVRVLRAVRENPKKPFIAIVGGAKVKDKLPVIEVLAKKADAVLVGGKLVHEIRNENIKLPNNVMVGKLNEDGFDISPDTTSAWAGLINKAAQIIWNGPLGKIDNAQLTIDNLGSAKGSYEIAKMILDSKAEITVGGGDTVSLLGSLGLLEKYEKKGFSASGSEREDAKTKSSVFISVGGGAMLKLLTEGTLPTIEVLV